MRPLRLTWVAWATCALLACGEDLRGEGTPEPTLDPQQLTFPVGVEARTVQLGNLGDGSLVVSEVSVGAGFSVAPTGRWTVAPGDTLAFEVRREDPEAGPTALVFTTAVGDLRVPIAVGDSGPEIRVNPGSVDFGRVPAGEGAQLTVDVLNVGTEPLQVAQVALNGSADFTVAVGNRDPRRQPEILADPDGDGAPGLAPGASFKITVGYAPLVEGPDAGELLIASDDPRRPQVRVPLLANGATPCLDVTPPALEFPGSLINRSDSRALAVESCGSEPLVITRVALADGTDPAFSLQPVALPLTLPAMADTRPSQLIPVSFQPREARVYNGRLIIESNDPVTPVRVVSLLGRGQQNACPQARVTREEHFVLPLDTVLLDGTPSLDPDGPERRPVRYRWSVVQSPAGSTSRPFESVSPESPADPGLPDDETTPTAQFFVDLAGTYVLRLHVQDNLGLDSTACDNPATVYIDARPEAAIHVQLVWDTPTDPDPTDAVGNDLDLHLLHPLARDWFTEPYDAYYGNPQPDWGQLENPADDPVLDIDDINGAGPENINLALPEANLDAPYLVGVHYYRSRDRQMGFDFGAAQATVRIFIEGELRWDSAVELPDSGQLEEGEFWDVAQIAWPSGEVTARDRISRR